MTVIKKGLIAFVYICLKLYVVTASIFSIKPVSLQGSSILRQKMENSWILSLLDKVVTRESTSRLPSELLKQMHGCIPVSRAIERKATRASE